MDNGGGQSYDGAGNMAGRYAGVLTLIQHQFPKFIFYYWTNFFWWKLVTQIAGSSPVLCAKPKEPSSNRSRQHSSLRRKTPMDFKSIALTTRPQLLQVNTKKCKSNGFKTL